MISDCFNLAKQGSNKTSDEGSWHVTSQIFSKYLYILLSQDDSSILTCLHVCFMFYAM